MKPTLAVVHNNIDDKSSIGAIAAWDVREALERGWHVTAVCRDLDPALAPHVTHRPLYVPARLHLLQWSVARPTVRAALRGVRPDVLLVHQPQLAAIADVWNVHYLSRAARQTRGPLAKGLRPRVQDLQAAGVAVLEDHYLRRVPASTRILFCGDGLRADFAHLYGAPRNARVLYNPAFKSSVSAPGRLPDQGLRSALVGDHAGPVVGFLGGGDVRKGADLVLDAVARDPNVFLVHAGPTRLDDSDPRLQGRTRGLGNLGDINELLDVVDVLLVPSRFDPFPLVVAEAASRGVPVLVAAPVGTAPLVAETGAGELWAADQPLGPAVARLVAGRAQFAAGGRRLADRLDPARLADERFAELDAALDRRRSQPS